MRDIVDQLNKWAHEYYVLDTPTVTDGEYDVLYDQLLRLERDSGTVLPDSPTRRVGGEPLEGFVQHTHLSRLYSLDKVQSLDQLSQWVDKLYAQFGVLPLSVELKYDGLTMSATYVDGQLVTVATRGNGTVGENVTAQAMTIRSLPLTINYTGTVELQGEVIMRLSQLDKFNANYPSKALKNARNAAAGAIRNLDPVETALRNLDGVFYSAGIGQDDIATSQTQLIQYLADNGFRTDKYFCTVTSSSQLTQLIEQIALDRDSLDYLIDGVVIKVDNFAVREDIGYTDKFPKWAVAYKFDAQVVETTLESIDWQVGRTGKVTPTANLTAIELCGATIKRATLNNYNDIVRKNLSLGAQVLIRRSNDVIPEVLGLAGNSSGTEIVPPTLCPSCNSTLEQYGAHLYCNNTQHCTPQIVARISHYCSRGAMDIRGVSDKTIEGLVNIGLLHSIADLYSLTADDLLQLEGYKSTRVDNVLTSISSSKKCQLSNFIYALGIDNIGSVTARDLATKYGSVAKLSTATVEDLLSIDGIGDTVAQGIVHFFTVDSNTEILSTLASVGIDPQHSVVSGGIFAGKKVVLTGSLEHMTRTQAAQAIVSNGGVISSSVGKSVNLVVVGSEAGSKLDKALALGIEIIDEQQFIQLLS